MRGRRHGRRPLFAGAALVAAGGLAGCNSEGSVAIADGSAASRPSSPEITFDTLPSSPSFGAVEVVGLPPEVVAALGRLPPGSDELRRLLPVWAGDPDDGIPPMAGDHRVVGGKLAFEPRFAPTPGVTYLARLEGAVLAELAGGATPGVGTLEASFTAPDPGLEPTTRVVGVHPAVAEVPANLLRLYVTFSAPMRPRGIAEEVRLLDTAGEPVELPFVEVEGGLWDPSGTRLTLVFHPGRIKRGVGPNVVMGPPLVAGESYRLVVGAGLTDAGGLPLAASHEHVFRVVEADREAPDPGAWRLVPPAAPSGPLAVSFGEPLDHALVRRMVSVEAAAGGLVPGRVEVGDDGASWSFAPGSEWSPGAYELVIDSRLEDLAGNRVIGVFDRELAAGEPAAGVPAAEPMGEVRLPFTVPPA